LHRSRSSAAAGFTSEAANRIGSANSQVRPIGHVVPERWIREVAIIPKLASDRAAKMAASAQAWVGSLKRFAVHGEGLNLPKRCIADIAESTFIRRRHA